MMKDRKEKDIYLIEISDKSNQEKKKNKITQIAIRDNSKYSSIKNKIEWPFDYEVNNVRFDILNKNKLHFIKDKDDNSSDSNNCLINLNIETVDFTSFSDNTNFEFPYDGCYRLSFWDKIKFSLKRLVSLKKRRIETQSFNLDMRYLHCSIYFSILFYTFWDYIIFISI